MSDIKIQPSATGSATVTLTAPTTGTARTVTLPDSTDTLAVNSDVTNKLPLAGGTMTGTIAGFTSTGIDDNADATAITIDSSENVNIVNGGKYLRFAYNSSNSHSAFQGWKHLQFGNNGANYIIGGNTATGGSLKFVVNNSVEMSSDNATSHNGTVSLDLKSDGRGLSQFTAKAWMRFDQYDSNNLQDSHNVSSVTDHGTGEFTMNFSNNMGNDKYCVQTTAHYGGSANDMGTLLWRTDSELTTSNARFYFMGFLNNGATGPGLYDVEEAMVLIFGD